MRILLVEDEPGIARTVARGLERERFQVEVYDNGAKALERALEADFDLILLDLMLPGMDGRQVCASLRERHNRVPILMLTALGEVEDKVRGFDLGADDYLPKPFEWAELLARVRALLRRDKMNRTRIIRIADLVVDTELRQVSRAGTEIRLSVREYELLEALARQEGRILTREVIQERVWMDEDSFSNTVDVYIGLLRKKIDAGHQEKLIHTVRGMGYTLRRAEPTDAKHERS